MPWLEAEQIGPNRLAFYLRPYLWLALPDLFLTAGLFFALATLTRSMMATYLGGGEPALRASAVFRRKAAPDARFRAALPAA